MKHRGVFCAGFGAATFGLFVPYLVVLHYCQAPWYVFRCVLTCATYLLAAWFGGKFAQCVSAYRDRAAQVAGYCRPLREEIRR